MKDSFLNRKFKKVYWNVCSYIVVINAAFFFIFNFLNIRIHGVPLLYWMSFVPAFVREGCVWQFITYMFVHKDTFHFLFNMYALWSFGKQLEVQIGSKEFLLFYFTVGILSAVLNYCGILIFGGFNMVILGASGAIYGVLFLISVLFPYARVLLFFVLPLKIPMAMLLFIVLEIISEITGTAADIAHLMHLSGIFVAYLYIAIRLRLSPFKVYKAFLGS